MKRFTTVEVGRAERGGRSDWEEAGDWMRKSAKRDGASKALKKSDVNSATVDQKGKRIVSSERQMRSAMVCKSSERR